MLKRRVLVGSGLVILPWICTARAEEPQLPADRVEQCVIHEDPNDPNSAVKLTVRLSVHALSQSGAWVEWRVTQIEIEQNLPTVGLWTMNNPTLVTVDGSWWVNHAAPASPVDAEFGAPPRMTGTAVSQALGVGNVQFTIESAQEPPADSPFMTSPLINYLLVMAQNNQTVGEGDENQGEIVDY